MQSEACKALRKQGYQFFSPRSSAALKPCMWNKRTLRGGDMCYKAQFYGIESHRCVQMTPTLKCNQRCLFCWRSMEYEVVEEEECPPELIMERLLPLQKKALAGYNPVANDAIDQKLWEEALAPDMAAVSLSGEPTLYSHLPRLFDLLNDAGFTTFLVTNGTRPVYKVTNARWLTPWPVLDLRTSSVSSSLATPWSEKKLGSIGMIASEQARKALNVRSPTFGGQSTMA